MGLDKPVDGVGDENLKGRSEDITSWTGDLLEESDGTPSSLSSEEGFDECEVGSVIGSVKEPRYLDAWSLELTREPIDGFEPTDFRLIFRLFETLNSEAARPCLLFTPVVFKVVRALEDCEPVNARGR